MFLITSSNFLPSKSLSTPPPQYRQCVNGADTKTKQVKPNVEEKKSHLYVSIFVAGETNKLLTVEMGSRHSAQEHDQISIPVQTNSHFD